MAKWITLTEQEKNTIVAMGHDLYTEKYLEEWINRNDNVFANPAAALNAMGAKGYYEAVKAINERTSAQWEPVVEVDLDGKTEHVIYWQCSSCEFQPLGARSRFCPSCGKIMKNGVF